jgi:hypothetical protein
VEAMRAVAAAYKKRSLDDFTAALSKCVTNISLAPKQKSKNWCFLASIFVS